MKTGQPDVKHQRLADTQSVRLTATLLLEVDVVLLPEPGVGQVAWVRLGLAGEECILGDVDGDVLRRRDDIGRPCAGEKDQTVQMQMR